MASFAATLKAVKESGITDPFAAAAFALGFTTGGSVPAPAPAPASKAGLVECVCGKVCLEFTNQTPRAHLECFCVDCKDWMGWAHSKGGQNPRISFDAVYFENDFAVTRGKENLKFFTMAPREANAEPSTIRAFSTCCWSEMVVQHPAYGGNVVCCCMHQVRECTYKPIQMQFCGDDLSAEDAALVEKLDAWRHTAFPVLKCANFAELVGNEGGKYTWIFDAFGEESGSHNLSTFNDILAEAGGSEMVNVDLKADSTA